MEKLQAKAQIGIQKSREEIFEAIVNPEIMQNFFISKGTNPLEIGKEINWEFPEFEGSYPVVVKEIIPNELVSFEWDPKSLVEIRLEKFKENDTIVKVTEIGYQNDEEGIKWLTGQTEGWANFLACMKAWLEYGIHLREGAFNYMFQK